MGGAAGRGARARDRLVSLGDPATDGFGELIAQLREIAAVSSIRVRLAGS